MEPGSSPSRGAMLDQAPPQPPGDRKRATLMDNQQQSGAPGAGLGAEAANPQIIALQGLAMIEQGTQLLSSAIPTLAPALTGLVANLRQVIPQAMADQVAGMGGAGAGQPGPGGVGAPAPAAPPQAPAGGPPMA